MVSEKYPLAKLLPKFMFLDALTYVQAGDADGFKAALKALLDKYPSEDVSELAGEMLKGVLRGRQWKCGQEPSALLRGCLQFRQFHGEAIGYDL